MVSIRLFDSLGLGSSPKGVTKLWLANMEVQILLFPRNENKFSIVFKLLLGVMVSTNDSESFSISSSLLVVTNSSINTIWTCVVLTQVYGTI